MVRVSPALFHWLGSFAGVRCSVSDESSAFRNRFVFFGFGLFWHLGNGSAASFRAFFHMDFATAAVVVVVVFTTTSRLVALIELIHHTSLDSLCAGQVKLSSARFNQTVIILKLSKLETSGH